MKTNWHTGLTDDQVLKSRREHGNNLLSPPPRPSWIRLFLEKFTDPIIRILLIAALLSLGISFVHQEFAETIGIFCAIFLSVGVAFWFEYDAGKKFDVLNQINDDSLFKVWRNGSIHEISKRDLVVGDLLSLESGDEVPADAELLESVSLQLNESSLTGEPMTAKTAKREEADTEATYPSHLIYRGSSLLDGNCLARVIAVGDATELGKIAKDATQESQEATPLSKQLERLARLIGVAGFSVAVLTFLALFFKDLLLGKSSYTAPQWYYLVTISIVASVALFKVWFPLVSIRAKNKLSAHWLVYLLVALLLLLIFVLVGIQMGFHPLDPASRLSLDQFAVLLQYFMVGVTLIVVAVPEGLPMSVTLSLALSMRRMLQTNNLVRKMHATETMGATTVICTDKTGTLTQNRMQVAHSHFYGLGPSNKEEAKVARLIYESIACNTTANLEYSQGEEVRALGNPTEGALLLWLHQQQINYQEVREQSPVLERITFSTERKFMASVVQSTHLGGRYLFLKGAPEIVLAKCHYLLTAQGVEPLAQELANLQQQLLGYQQQAMRTLAFAYLDLTGTTSQTIQDWVQQPLTLLGVTAIADPVREDVPEAVQSCLQAGIQIKIVTGDTAATAQEIARRIGIWQATDSAPQQLLSGPEFAALNEEEAYQYAQSLKILCRARPGDKQRLVQLLQQAGEVVAVTGDGTNDAPALNHAHVGLAMGTGTSVAKEAGDITLLDDSFRSIATAVMWGRSLYKNIQRFLFFQLTINLTALVVVLLGSLFGSQLPLTVTQMLWINLIMDTFAAGALASLPPNPQVMQDSPRSSTAFILSPLLLRGILWVGSSFVVLLLGLLYYYNQEGAISPLNLSRFFTFFVLLQVWNLFNAKALFSKGSALKNLSRHKAFLTVVLLILAGQWFIVQFGGEVFRTVPLSLHDWFILLASSSFVLWINELFRWIKRLSR